MKKAFTLVELIIVITILAVLATIAFVSFSNYTVSSRDTKRIVTIESIAKGLNIFQTQTGKYPNIDNQSSTGIINSDTLSFVGEVGDNVSRLINISPTPIDPVSGNNFKYATSFDNKYFQVAGTQEKPVAEKSILSQAYANSRQAKVLGNYSGLLKKENKLYNLPSLLYTGSGNLLSNTTYFVIDKGQNIPYKISSTDLDNSVQTSVILSQLTGTSSVSLTGVTLPSTPGELKANIDSVVQILGYPGDKIGQETFGTQYFVENSSSNVGGNSPALTQWRDLDTNCTIDDIVIGNQIWAGCNSTLGNGVEWGKRDNGTDGTIFNCNSYNDTSNIANCPIATSSNSMFSSMKENAWSATNSSVNASGRVDNIWGKLYTWTNSPSACPAGWRVPSDIDFQNLESNLGCPANEVTRNGTWGCSGLGWNGHTSRNMTNNVIQALKIPLAGRRNTDGLTFLTRGNHVYLWSSTSPSSDNANYRFMRWDFPTILHDVGNVGFGFSVRCIKN